MRMHRSLHPPKAYQPREEKEEEEQAFVRRPVHSVNSISI